MTGSRGALGLLAAAVVGLAGACATPSLGRPGPAGAGSPPAVSGAPSGQAAPSQPVAPSEQAAIYTAVLRRYLTSGDNSFGDDHRFPVAYVLDRTDAGAADPMGGSGPATPIPAADQAAILAGLAEVGRVEFVADRATVIEEPDSCARVRGDGILVVLGPAVEAAGHREVAIHGFVACLGATWFTYIVERDGAGWRTNGTTGSFAIA